MDWQGVDRFAREQKRRWFAETRRWIKIARERLEEGSGRVLARVRRQGTRLEHEAARLARKRGEHGRRAIKIGRERGVNIGAAAVTAAGKAGRSVWGVRKPFVRVTRRVEKLGEQYRGYREEWTVEREIARLVTGSDPILFGPWTSEVGYEALYWVAFVRWVKMHHRLKSDRLAVMSRGGVASWYADVTPRYVEMFDLVPPDEVASRAAARVAGAGTAKQMAATPFDVELIERARAHLGTDRLRVVHPSLMYRLFRQFWIGHRPLGFIESHTRFQRLAPIVSRVATLPGLPSEYVAVKFYAAQSLPDSVDNRRMLRRIIDALAEQHPVVLLDTGLALDEHGDYQFARSSRVTSIKEFLRPADNLGIQTQVIAGARGFVGTCGSVAWLAPMLGVDTLAVMTDARFLHSHLNVARWAYRTLDAGRFSPVDLGALAGFGLDVTSVLQKADC